MAIRFVLQEIVSSSRSIPLVARGVRVWKKTETMSGGDKRVRANPIIANIGKTSEFKAIFNPGVEQLIGIFKGTGYEIRLAGGPVRDLLQGKVPKDIDIATTATPAQMKTLFAQFKINTLNVNGEKHGTVTARLDNTNYEITTLRIDTETDGRHAKVMFTNDWELDANRRDLTINSMFLDFTGNVHDYFYGYEDLMAKKVAFVGDASARIQEDYLRILRYFRFYGRIADDPNNHEPATLSAIKENINGLAQISGERIWMELFKILQGNFASELLMALLDCGAAKYIGLPETPNVDAFKEVSTYHTTASPLHPMTLVSALLHSPDDALKLHGRLKLSNFDRDLAFFITQNREEIKLVSDLRPLQKMCFNSSGSAMRTKPFTVQLLKYLNKSDWADQMERWIIPLSPITGAWLKEHQCPDGVVMGLVKKMLTDKWIDSNFLLTGDDLKLELPQCIEQAQEKVKTSPQANARGKRKLK